MKIESLEIGIVGNFLFAVQLKSKRRFLAGVRRRPKINRKPAPYVFL